jgi:uncharacterized membrane protein YhiD involved in acid resistance
MKTLIKASAITLTVFILIFAIGYLTGIFILLEPNCFKWDEFNRTILVVCSASITLAIMAIIAADYKNN